MTAIITPFPGGRQAEGTVVAICGGVGGAKLAHGLYEALPPGTLTVIVNTADDFQHLGLHISPDLDTVLYTLGGRADMERGWGRADETWHCLSAAGELGGDQWFQIGDRDMAMHVMRTHWLQWGKTLSSFAEHVTHNFGIRASVLPMSNDVVSTWISTHDGLMPFQHYFVKEQCAPIVKGVHFEGAAEARLPLHVRAALYDKRLKAIIICPSNPYLSIDPILAIPEIKTAIENASCPVVAVSPIIAGKAVKGPTAKIMEELGLPTSWTTIARHYSRIANGLLINEGDLTPIENCPMTIETAPILMKTLEDRRHLAETVLGFAARLAAKHPGGGNSPVLHGRIRR
jgi:LPPG:FO 2-phospho-L-lactate transferase